MLTAAANGADVLILESDAALARAIAAVLRREGLEPRTATGLVQALKGPAPDLVLLAGELAEGSGLAACQALRRTPLWGGVPLLMLAARCRETEREKALALGVDAYLCKPFAIDTLMERVRHLLRTPEA
jgi:DNA-binding response OmpR family regulator